MNRLGAAWHLLRVLGSAWVWWFALRRTPGLQGVINWNRRRFRHYYWGTTYLAAVFSARSGRGRSARERRLFVQMAALAAYFDEINEQGTAPPSDIGWKQKGAALDGRGLAWPLLQAVRSALTLEQSGPFEAELDAVYRSETVRELSDKPEGLSKGAHSVLLFRSLLSPPAPAAERAAWYAFGQLIQLCDDVFDVWFDAQSPGTASTLPLRFLSRNDVPGLVDIFEKQVLHTRQCLLALPGRGGAKAWATLFFLVATARVALAHYRRVGQREGILPLEDRKTMVVDMSRWANRFRWLAEILRKSVRPPDLP